MYLDQCKNDSSGNKDISFYGFFLSQSILASSHVVGPVRKAGGMDMLPGPTIAKRMGTGAAGWWDIAVENRVILRTIDAATLVL